MESISTPNPVKDEDLSAPLGAERYGEEEGERGDEAGEDQSLIGELKSLLKLQCTSLLTSRAEWCVPLAFGDFQEEGDELVRGRKLRDLKLRNGEWSRPSSSLDSSTTSYM